MPTEPQVRFYLGANSPAGFYSLYDELIDPLEAKSIFILKGGAGCGKSTFMRQVARQAEEKGLPVEYIPCSGDPDSLDAVILPGQKSAIVDGTAPHVVEPRYPGVVERYVNLGDCYDYKALAGKREEIVAAMTGYKGCYAQAYRCLSAAEEVTKNLRSVLETPEMREKMGKRARGILKREGRRRELPVALAVPINLRPHFPSRTLRNFILTVRPTIDPELGDYSFPEIVAQVHHHMRLHITRQEMQAVITRNVALQKNKLLQLVPAPLKNLSMAVSYRLVGCRPYSTTYTNPGAFSVPPEMAPYIQRMEVILGQSYTPRANCASISYGNTMEITFAGTVKETDVERDFFRHLVREGIPVKVISNREE